ncbi:hypothetical protein DENSPDRAFT_666720 [Dentipellis sp. KUC8613]|nr:hypothetical protein DENSPDRAFT_666720 [Dentipellis sp. KUC8613]
MHGLRRAAAGPSPCLPARLRARLRRARARGVRCPALPLPHAVLLLPSPCRIALATLPSLAPTILPFAACCCAPCRARARMRCPYALSQRPRLLAAPPSLARRHCAPLYPASRLWAPLSLPRRLSASRRARPPHDALARVPPSHSLHHAPPALYHAVCATLDARCLSRITVAPTTLPSIACDAIPPCPLRAARTVSRPRATPRTRCLARAPSLPPWPLLSCSSPLHHLSRSSPLAFTTLPPLVRHCAPCRGRTRR